MTVVDGDHHAPFLIATKQQCKEVATTFLGSLNISLMHAL